MDGEGVKGDEEEERRAMLCFFVTQTGHESATTSQLRPDLPRRSAPPESKSSLGAIRGRRRRDGSRPHFLRPRQTGIAGGQDHVSQSWGVLLPPPVLARQIAVPVDGIR